VIGFILLIAAAALTGKNNPHTTNIYISAITFLGFFVSAAVYIRILTLTKNYKGWLNGIGVEATGSDAGVFHFKGPSFKQHITPPPPTR
jgi:hypothetical protein